MTAFPCTKCGACCRRVGLAHETKFLDRGDGVCMHYDAGSKGCSIYDERPEICRIEGYFRRHYQQVMTWDLFVEANLSVCRQLELLEMREAE